MLVEKGDTLTISVGELQGTPKWHYKYKFEQKNSQGKWTTNKSGIVKAANNVQGNVGEQQTIMMTSQQLASC